MVPGQTTDRETVLGMVAGYTAAALILLGMLIGTMLLPGVAYPF